MDNKTKNIISVKTLDKRETEKKSVNLEKAGFLRCLQEIQDKGLTVSEVVTDAHLQIGAMMSKYNRGIPEKFIKNVTFENFVHVYVIQENNLLWFSIAEKDYPDIKHSHDIWHAAKNLGKKLLAVSDIIYSST